MKKIIAILTALFIILPLAVSCGNNENVSSLPVSSEVATLEESSSETSFEPKKEESKKESSTNKTSSVKDESEESSSRKNAVRPDDEEDTSSETESESIKIYKNNHTAQIACYNFEMKNLDALGTTDSAKEEEFADFVNQKYFNTYYISLDKYALKSAEIIAKSGATLWLMPERFNSKNTKIENFIENVKYYVDLLTKYGYGDIINGFHWDEPVWNGQTNADFLAMTKALYQNFGLRNYPVFALGEFSDLEGNLDVNPDDMNKVETSSLVYITDVGYDSYGVDVRDGVDYTHRLPEWQEKISPNVVDGKSYYTEYKEYLKRHVNHPVNFWYYPSAHRSADEGFALGHLEFMAQDVLKEEYVGGIAVYTYYPYNDEPGFLWRSDIKNEHGDYKYANPNYEVWHEYCDALRRIRKEFDEVSIKKAKLNV